MSIDDNFHNISRCRSINLHPMWNTCHYEICIMNSAFERVPYLRTRYDDGGITYALRQGRFSYWELSIFEKVNACWMKCVFIQISHDVNDIFYGLFHSHVFTNSWNIQKYSSDEWFLLGFYNRPINGVAQMWHHLFI